MSSGAFRRTGRDEEDLDEVVRRVVEVARRRLL